MEEFNHFDLLAEQYDQKANKLVRAAAFKVERGAKGNAPVDTGALRSSIYVKTEDSSDYGKTGLSAMRKNADVYLFPEVEDPGHNAAFVAVGVSYGVFVEYGTSRRGAHPYFTPAFEAEREPFLSALQKLIDSGEGAGLAVDDGGGD